jgi:hypothetical protein
VDCINRRDVSQWEGRVTMLQSIYADRLSDEVLAVSASLDVRTEDSDVKSNLDTGESSANREPCVSVWAE